MAKLLTMVLKAIDLCFNCGGSLYSKLCRRRKERAATAGSSFKWHVYSKGQRSNI